MAQHKDSANPVEREEIARRIERCEATLRAAGVRLTPQRVAIYREVARRFDHPDAESVHRAVRRQMPTLSLDTVYRTLLLLRDLGLLTALGPRRESVRFDAHLGPHDHFVCLQCGMTRDIDSLGVDVRQLPPAVTQLGAVVQARVEVQGICRACQEGEKEKKARKRRGGT